MEVDAYIAGPIAAGADPTDEQFRLLVQSVTDYAIFLLDSGGRVISWNDGAERIKGYSAGEIVGRSIALFYPPEDRDAGKPEQGLRCAEREGRFRTEGWRVRKDGSRFWADVAITALRDARGGLRGFAKVTRDMTARHRERENEQRVAAMLERSRGLAEISLLALGETGLQPVLERTVALTRDLLQTEFVRVLELLPAGDAFKLVAGTGWKPGMVGSATGPLRANSILRYTFSSGALVPDAANQPRRAAVIEDLASEDRFPRSGMLHEHGIVSGMSVMIPGRRTPYGVLGAHSAARRRFVPGDAEFLQAIANVVSAAVQRQRAHEQVQASEARLVAFADHSPAVMFLKDREGRYRLVNEPFLQRFGLRRDQVIGRTDLELFPRDQALRFAANDAEVLSRGVPLQFEESARYIEGERINVVAKFPLPDASGAVIGVGGIATDITERKRTEQALREQRTLLAEAQNLAGLGCWEWDAASRGRQPAGADAPAGRGGGGRAPPHRARAARPRRAEPVGPQHQPRPRARRRRRVACAPAHRGFRVAGRRHAAIDRERDGGAAPAAARRIRARSGAGLVRRGVFAPHRHRRGVARRRGCRGGPAPRGGGGAVPHRAGGAQQRRQACRGETGPHRARRRGGGDRHPRSRRRRRLRPGGGRARQALGHEDDARARRSEEHTSELQSRGHLVCRLLLEKKKQIHDR